MSSRFPNWSGWASPWSAGVPGAAGTRTDWHCLALVKTGGEGRAGKVDELATFQGLVRWLERREILPASWTGSALRSGRGPRTAMRAAVVNAWRVRTVTYRVLAARAKSEPPAARDLGALSAYVRDAATRRRLVATGSAYGWQWIFESTCPDSLTAPVIWSLAELLTAPEAGRLRRCAHGACGQLYIDSSPGVTRRDCGEARCAGHSAAPIARMQP